ncbi:hypothetical protein GIB67_026938 [Kingdonia uniflora]|uniref:Transcription repressor n=1 Tax=Kingdonia uniflora TaxID=39325 RepID=A0A7J7P1Q1_9MAGN|nr:hypothetical protein GIB67_026938 [Kingdonia uniflora]
MSSTRRKLLQNKITVNIGCSCRRPKLSAIFWPKPKPKAPNAHKNPDVHNTSTTSLGLKDNSNTTFSPKPYYEPKNHPKSSKTSNVYGKIGESVAVVKDSNDPYLDFRHSMLQMIMEKEIYSKDDLRELLDCFLSLNSPYHHDIIIRAFTEIWHGDKKDEVLKVLGGISTFQDCKGVGQVARIQGVTKDNNTLGYWYLPAHHEAALAVRSQFEARDDDIIIISPPKAGRTWLKALISSILNVLRDCNFDDHEDEWMTQRTGVHFYGPYLDHVLEYWKKSLDTLDKIMFFIYEQPELRPFARDEEVKKAWDCWRLEEQFHNRDGRDINGIARLKLDGSGLDLYI